MRSEGCAWQSLCFAEDWYCTASSKAQCAFACVYLKKSIKIHGRGSLSFPWIFGVYFRFFAYRNIQMTMITSAMITTTAITALMALLITLAVLKKNTAAPMPATAITIASRVLKFNTIASIKKLGAGEKAAGRASSMAAPYCKTSFSSTWTK